MSVSRVNDHCLMNGDAAFAGRLALLSTIYPLRL
jgi:hypothetical protein